MFFVAIDTFKHKTDKYSVHFQEMPGFKGKRKGGLTLTLYKKKHFDIQCLYIACITAKETSKNLFGVEDPVKMSLSFFGPDINRMKRPPNNFPPNQKNWRVDGEYLI
jgi:hypothetical protein